MSLSKDAPDAVSRVRMSVRELNQEVNKDKLNAFLRAWKLIKELPVDNPNSFWAIAGYHGEPFRPRENENEKQQYWGGYCQHQNVLFPTWHRFYVLRLEQSLRTVCPNDDVTMPYWDQTSPDNLEEGIPELLVKQYVTIDGKEEENPLRSFILPAAISPDEADKYYEKPKGYTTVRYPFSGIQSPEIAKIKAELHNKKVEGMDDIEEALGKNLVCWLNKNQGLLEQYQDCLNAEDYTKFSNTESANSYCEMPLEEPHNGVHLAVGGYTMDDYSAPALIEGANGDMGENETAGFDPVFFFHHCNVDRMFWVWQKKHGCTDNFEIDANAEGTNASEGQGPTPGQETGEQLNMSTILYPFQHPNGVPVDSKDCINIEKQLGYTYTIGSLDQENWPQIKTQPTIRYSFASYQELRQKLETQNKTTATRVIFDIIECKDFPEAIHTKSAILIAGIKWYPTIYLRISNINSDLFLGSYLVRAYYKTRDANSFIGQRSVLSRWSANLCRNCQFHRRRAVFFDVTDAMLTWPPCTADFQVYIIYRDPENCTKKVLNITEEILKGKEEDTPVIKLAVAFQKSK